MVFTTESESKKPNPQILSGEHAALNEMLSADKESGELSPGDKAIYKELIQENREGFIAFNKAGEAVGINTVAIGPAQTSERSRQSALNRPDDGVEKAREAVMRQFGNIEDNWHNNNK